MTSRLIPPGLLRAVVVAVTVVFTALALVVGRGGAAPIDPPVVGEVADETFTATESISITDDEATAIARQAARLQVPTQYELDASVTNAVLSDIRSFFSIAREGAQPEVPEFIPDEGAETITPPVTEPPAEEGAGGTETTVAGDEVPPEETVAAEEEQATTTTTTTLPATTTSSTVPPPPIERQALQLETAFPFLQESTRDTMLEVLNDDFARDAAGEAQVFDAVEQEALVIARELLTRDGGILAAELDQVKVDLFTSPPFVLLSGLDADQRRSAQIAIADIVANALQANKRIDQLSTDELRLAAEQSVDPIETTFVAGEVIVEAGELFTEVRVEAIVRLGLLEPEAGERLEALAAVAAIAVLLVIFFLWRVAYRQWAKPKLVMLFGLLVVAAAGTARIPELFPVDQPELGYLLPAAFFGYVATILFDSRTAALMAIPIATFTALSTGDVGLTAFAAGATMAPVPFVSSVSSRTRLRLAVLYSALVLAPLAGSIAWFFSGSDLSWRAAIVAFVSGIGSGVIALGVLPFLENLFRITTTLTLLDLTDRNHDALRLIEEEAPGTFNHSILVGTLAGKAARAIGANPLLAQAAAYYHDLGKTVRPQFFIENQFGVSNPHDEMTPVESAQVIRSHVDDGLRLARQFKIPSEVSDGIRMHHGTGLMRYFYHKSLAEDPGTEPELFRHRGERPVGKEMAILMLSDAVEGATRALVQHEDPTSAGIGKLVDQVVTEKVEDHQLDASALTFGELTRVKEALVDALLAYYHTRIPYPGFPGREAGAATR